MEDWYEKQDKMNGEMFPELQVWAEKRNQEQLTAELSSYYEGREVGEEDYLYGRHSFWELTRISEMPKPVRVLTEKEETLVKALGVTTVITDVLATSLSLTGSIMEVGFGLIDGPTPFGELIGVAAYELYVNPIENALSTIGFGATALSDIIQGNTYVDASNGQKVIVKILL